MTTFAAAANPTKLAIIYNKLVDNDVVLSIHPTKQKMPAVEKVVQKEKKVFVIGDNFKTLVKLYEDKLTVEKNSPLERSKIMEDFFQNMRGNGEDTLELREEKANTLGFMYQKYML